MTDHPRVRQPLDEGAIMLPSDRPARRAVAGAIGTGAIAGAMLFGAAATAAAQPALPLPPCTAAELSFVMSGVNFDTANYLSTHPEVNNYFTTLKGKPKDQIPGSGPDLSRRQSASQGRHSAHPATGGRLPEPLWGRGDPLTVSPGVALLEQPRAHLPDVPDPWREGL